MLIDIRATKLYDNRNVKDLLENMDTRRYKRQLRTQSMQNTLNKILGDISPKWKKSSHLAKEYLCIDNDDRILIGVAAKRNNTLNGTWSSKHIDFNQIHLSLTIGTVAIPTGGVSRGTGLILPISELKNEIYYSPENVFNLLRNTVYVDDQLLSIDDDRYLRLTANEIFHTMKTKKADLTDRHHRNLITHLQSLMWVLKSRNQDLYCGVEQSITKKKLDGMTLDSYELINDLIVAGYYFLAKTHDHYGVVQGRIWR